MKDALRIIRSRRPINCRWAYRGLIKFIFMNIILLDTETTDLNNARLVQLAYKDLGGGDVVNEYFKPPVPISFGAMSTHHITEEMVSDKPAFQDSAPQQKLLEMLSDAVVVAHNATFDLQVLKNEGVDVPVFIDTLRVARHLLESEQYKLQYLRYSLGLNVVGANAHDALGDILVLEALFKHLHKIVKEKYSLAADDDVIEKMIALTLTPALLTTINFGKYKGKTFKEISLLDKSYLQWLYNTETQKSPAEQNEELVFTLKIWLG
jgi:exodeoxyribonuclease X